MGQVLPVALQQHIYRPERHRREPWQHIQRGKTSISFEVSDQQQKSGRGALSGWRGQLDTTYPKPSGGPQGIGLTKANLTALGTTTPPSASTASSGELCERPRVRNDHSLDGGSASHRGDIDRDRRDRRGQAGEPGGRWSAGASSATQFRYLSHLT